MKKTTILALIIFISIPALAVTNIIDPEIPVDTALLNNEQNFGELLITTGSVVLMASAGMTATILIILLTAAAFYGIKIL